MPIAPGMIRKPSTCSLPASLLMEQQGMTPSSSCEGLSPTGSTCSLGMVGHSHSHHIRRTPTPSHTARHSTSHTQSVSAIEQGRHSSKSESSVIKEESSSVAVMDSAIVKAGPSFHSPPLTSPDSVTSDSSKVDISFPSDENFSSESPLRGVSGHSSTSATTTRHQTVQRTCSGEKSTSGQSSSDGGAKANGPVHVPSSATGASGDNKEELTSSWKSVGNVSNSSSWADEAVLSGEAGNINCPEWANMSSNSSKSSTPASATRQHSTTSANGSSMSSNATQHSTGGHHHHKGQHGHQQQQHNQHSHHHHHHHQSTPSSSRIVHQKFHSSNSLSDIIPIQTYPSQLSPFHSPPSSSSTSFSSSSTSSSGPPSSQTSNSQHPTESHSHPLPTTTTAISTTTISTAVHLAKHKQTHAVLAKRNSSELSNQSSPVLQAPPPQQVYVGGNRTPNIVGVTASGPNRGASGGGGAGGHNWIMRPVLLPNHPVTVIGVPVTNRNQHHHQIIHTSNPPPVTLAHNGLMRTVPQQNRLPNSATIVPATFVPTHHQQPGGGGGLVTVCPPVNINHIQGSGPPVMCFNCGKRGHLGNSCPGVTMETNNPDSKGGVCIYINMLSFVARFKLCLNCKPMLLKMLIV